MLCSVKLKKFSKFEDTDAAVAAATAICDGKLDKNLKKFLKKSVDAEKVRWFASVCLR
jgi:nucleolar protein 58